MRPHVEVAKALVCSFAQYSLLTRKTLLPYPPVQPTSSAMAIAAVENPTPIEPLRLPVESLAADTPARMRP
jgi:hypothetical protein